VNFQRVRVLWHSFFRDFVLFSATCVGVLVLGIEYGLGLAIAVQVLLYPWKRIPIQLEEREGVLHVSGMLNYVEVHRLIEVIEDDELDKVCCSQVHGIDAGAMVELEKQSHVLWSGWPESIKEKLSPMLLSASS
jgi:hypothetical protein